MEDDDDESLFEMLDLELETDVNEQFTAAAMLGARRANAGGVTKHHMLTQIINYMN